MAVPPPEPGVIKTVVETLLKPFTLVLNPIAEQIGHLLRRKPKLHIYVHPQLSAWCYAWEGYGENAKPMMQARFTADITNDSRDEGLLILDGYIEGTQPQISFLQQIGVPQNTTITDEQIAVFVRPIVGEAGNDFTGRVVLIDQFKRKHVSDKITFKWVGPTTPKPPTSSFD